MKYGQSEINNVGYEMENKMHIPVVLCFDCIWNVKEFRIK